MNTPKSTDSKEFFYNERTARVMLILCGVLAIVDILGLAFGVIRPVLTFLNLLGPTMWAFYQVWVIWLGRRYPIFTVSEQLVEWRRPDSRKRSSIPSSDIIHAEKVTAHVVVLRTISKGSIRIPLGGGLSQEDRQQIKELIKSQFGVGDVGGQYARPK
jgi:hypothetical protein